MIRGGPTLLAAALLALAGCGGEPASEAPERTGRADTAAGDDRSGASIRSVRLVDSIPWETELASGVLHRIELRYDGRRDTVPEVTTSRDPLVVGDSVVWGFDSRQGTVAGGFRYSIARAETERIELPDDLLPFAAFGLSPDARHIAYLARTPGGELQAVVRTWPGRELVWESHPVSGYPSDAENSAVRWSEPDEVTIRIRLDDLETPGGLWLEARGAPEPGAMAADTVRGE